MAFGSQSEITQTELHGRRLGLTNAGNLAGGGVRLTHPAVGATITVSDENTNVRDITIQVTDANGDDVAEVTPLRLFVFANAAGTAYATTGGSTGIEAGTDGAILAVVAKKVFEATTEADGDIDLTWTDTGTEAAYLGVQLPSGNIVISDALTNA